MQNITIQDLTQAINAITTIKQQLNFKREGFVQDAFLKNKTTLEELIKDDKACTEFFGSLNKVIAFFDLLKEMDWK